MLFQSPQDVLLLFVGPDSDISVEFVNIHGLQPAAYAAGVGSLDCIIDEADGFGILGRRCGCERRRPRQLSDGKVTLAEFKI